MGDAQEFLEVGTGVRVGDRVGVAMDSCAVIPAYVAVLCMYCPRLLVLPRIFVY